jgi:branched-chain amino acid transport system substrate-binding protein
MRGGPRAWRGGTQRISAVAVLLLLAAGGGCADESDDDGGGGNESGPVKIGMLTTCGGPFAVFEAQSFSGAKYALIRSAGGRAQGTGPQDGVTAAKIAGRPVRLAFGCSDATPDKATAEARRLVEDEDVDILLGPLSGDEGVAVANYAKTQPGVTFVNGTSGAQETTLRVKSPNFFRFGGDGAQWMAGTGTYAYKELGWRKAAILGEDYSYPYTLAAGFTGEFCALGGQITKRLWAPLDTTDWSSYVNQLPKNVDGVLFLTGGANTVAALKAYINFGGKIAGEAMGGSSVLDPTAFAVGPKLAGLVGGSPVPLGGDSPEWTEYVDGFGKVYPKVAADSLFTVLYYDGMEAIIQGLEQTDGNLGGNQQEFQKALAGLEPDFPNGSVRLDENRNSIQPAYVVEVTNDGGKLGFAVKDEIMDVDETFGGLFSADSPPPSRDAPACEKGDPPSWAQ